MFLDQQSAQNRLPVVLLSGFLGSGKTTLVNALLRDPAMADTAVAVNEFGEVPLDQLLIEHGADQTVVLANGCLCCRLAGDFEDAVMRIFTRRETGTLPEFTRLIIEPSGLADTAPIAQTILRNPVMSAVLRLEAMITTVDAVLVRQQIERYPETRKQIVLADRLVLTKTDLVTPDVVAAVRRLLRDLNPVAPLHLAIRGAVDVADLLPPGFVSSQRRSVLFAEPVTADHGGETEAVSLTSDSPLRWRAFDTWLRSIRISHAEKVMRIKGMLNIAGAAGPVVIQGVEHVMHAPVVLDRWPDADRRSRVVVISRGLAPGIIQESWRQALPGLLATH